MHEAGDLHTICRADTAAHYQGAVARVIVAMRERLDEELLLDEMAEIAYMSPFHLNRVFRWITGVPPRRFLAAVRLEAAKRMLLQSDRSVTDVSLEVGYSSLGTFTRRFTSQVGLSPGSFRSLAADRLGASLPALCAGSRLEERPADPAGAGIEGVIEAAPGFAGWIFVGLFASAIPQGRPLACALRRNPEPFRLAPVPDGEYHLVSAGLPAGNEPSSYLLNECAWRGGVRGTVRVRRQQPRQPIRLVLHPPGPFDPPILVTFPLLLGERLGRRRTAWVPGAAGVA